MVAKKIVTVHGSRFGVKSIMQSDINLEPGTCERLHKILSRSYRHFIVFFVQLLYENRKSLIASHRLLVIGHLSLDICHW